MNIEPRFPPGLPERIAGDCAWAGPDMAARASEWIEPLNEAELAELKRAAEPWAASGHDMTAMGAADFPLPTLAPRLRGVLHTLLHGRGFVLLRGLPVLQWGRALSAAAFYGLGLHLGAPRSQNAAGHLLGHVRDEGLASNDPNVRIYQTHERQTFHTDSCDLVGLLCLRTARSGGLSALVSSVTLYNELRARRPELAAALFEPVATDRRGEVPPGQKPYFEIPVFNWHEGCFSAIYQRQYVNSAQRFADAPRLSALQVQALDALDAMTNDPQLHLTMALQPGDVQIVHNHVLLHDRTDFEDWPQADQRRHLLRLWLAPAQAQPLPPVYAQRYGSITPGERGGIVSRDGRLRANWEP